jgi:hypothetical protein
LSRVKPFAGPVASVLVTENPTAPIAISGGDVVIGVVPVTALVDDAFFEVVD